MTYPRITLSALAGLAFLSGQVMATEAPPSEDGHTGGVFTPEQEARIGQVAADYLLAHPDILIQVSQKLQTQQQDRQIKAITAAVLANQDALVNDRNNPSYGPADAKVVLVELFDYQCVICSQEAPALQAVMKANPQVRYVFKSWPIFAQRWENSLKAAQKGLEIWKSAGADAWLAYHNGIFATGHDEGALTSEDISSVASTALKGHPIKGGEVNTKSILDATNKLAQTLALQGTPALIVMPVKGATEKNVTVIPGGAGQETLQKAIDKAAGKPQA
ncbi:TPA: thioredoxin domain-containing protein [Salmonella enterica subsp. enterica serovar Napoli]|nr:thioredoxin domain-containing protein [Salmonella enterica subsp. enterica serovar Napoli]HBC0352931.1 thioredoxin domain-containing protein [Salmonella enterica subsp. enterica serovar Napoli]